MFWFYISSFPAKVPILLGCLQNHLHGAIKIDMKYFPCLHPLLGRSNPPRQWGIRACFILPISLTSYIGTCQYSLPHTLGKYSSARNPLEVCHYSHAACIVYAYRKASRMVEGDWIWLVLKWWLLPALQMHWPRSLIFFFL